MAVCVVWIFQVHGNRDSSPYGRSGGNKEKGRKCDFCRMDKVSVIIEERGL
jgi:hypothetical protein